jgi:hypothetical protein
LLDLLLSEVLPGNGFGLLQVEISLDHCYFLGAPMIKLNGLQFSGELQAMSKVVLPGLQDFVMEMVAEASEDQLVLKELGHVIHALEIGLAKMVVTLFSSHGGRLAVHEVFVGCLDPDVVVVDCLARLLDEVSKVSTGCMSRVRLEVLLLHSVPVFQVDVIVS